MTSMKTLMVNSRTYTVTLRRFDDVISPQYGAEYHGYYIDIQSQNATVTARRYDDEDVVSIQQGVNPDDSTLVEDVRQIARGLCCRSNVYGLVDYCLARKTSNKKRQAF